MANLRTCNLLTCQRLVILWLLQALNGDFTKLNQSATLTSTLKHGLPFRAYKAAKMSSK